MRSKWRRASWHDGSCSMPRAQRLLNGLATLASLLAAAFLLAHDGPLHEAVHAAVPAAAFVSALAGCAAGGPAWVAHLAMVLNVAAVVMLSAFAVAAGLDGGGAWLAALNVAGALLTCWNVVGLSSPSLDA